MKIETMEPKTGASEVSASKVVSEAEWLVARKDLLTREKELTRLRDEVSRHRRELPWVKVDKEYVFDGPEGKETLTDLFADRSQLIVYHFMLGPGWEEGCKSCSYLAGHFDGANWHLPHRDVTFVVISRAPLSEIERYKKRMGWRFKWISSHSNDFNFDYHVSFTKEEEKKNKACYNYEVGEYINDEMPGLSVFLQRGERRCLSHLFHLCARARYSGRRLQLPRSRAEGSRRRPSGFHDGLGPPSRRVLSGLEKKEQQMNRVTHFEIYTDDLEAVQPFYRDVFGWKFQKFEGGPMEYWLVTTGDDKEPGINGGLTRPREGQSPGTLNTVAVASLDQTIRKIEQRGGKICVPKMAIPKVGWLAYAADPAGNVFGIIEPARAAK